MHKENFNLKYFPHTHTLTDRALLEGDVVYMYHMRAKSEARTATTKGDKHKSTVLDSRNNEKYIGGSHFRFLLGVYFIITSIVEDVDDCFLRLIRSVVSVNHSDDTPLLLLPRLTYKAWI